MPKEFPFYVTEFYNPDNPQFPITHSSFALTFEQSWRALQHHDLLAAYRYANTILQKNLSAWDAKDWELCIKTLHKYAARSLLAGLTNPIQAGEYTQERMIIFRQFLDLSFHERFEKVAESHPAFKDFLDQCKRIKNKLSSSRSDSVGNDIFMIVDNNPDLAKHPGYKYFRALCDVGALPKDIPHLMHRLCDTLAQHFKSADPDPYRIAGQALYDLFKIHPFPNANGRVGRILANMILVYFGRPAIVVREHDDYQATVQMALDTNRPEILATMLKTIDTATLPSVTRAALFKDQDPIMPWDTDTTHVCIYYPQYLAVVPPSQLSIYSDLRLAAQEEKDPSVRKKINTLIKQTCTHIINGSYFQEQAEAAERLEDLHLSYFYYFQAAYFYTLWDKPEKAAKMMDKAHHIRTLIAVSKNPESAGTKDALLPAPTP